LLVGAERKARQTKLKGDGRQSTHEGVTVEEDGAGVEMKLREDRAGVDQRGSGPGQLRLSDVVTLSNQRRRSLIMEESTRQRQVPREKRGLARR
jgi:hypothetical protein